MDQESRARQLELVRNYWNSLAQQWEEEAGKRPLLEQRWEDWWPSIRPFLPDPGPEIKLLEAGCGVAYTSNLLAKFGYRVKACDLSPVMIEFAQSRSKTLALNLPVQYLVSSIDQMPYQAEEFDIVLSHRVLDFTPRPAYALKELRRVSRPGAKLVLSTLGANSPVKCESWKRFLEGMDHTGERYTNVFNGIAPWEVESLLPVLGWKFLHHEAKYNPSLSRQKNQFNEGMLQGQPLLFQQTACTIWTVVAEAV